MASNLERYKNDLDRLIALGQRLEMAMQSECYPEQFKRALKDGKPELKEVLAKLPPFRETYQAWYSEAKVLIKQLLPDRLADFVRHYEKPKPRKDISYENYRIEDYLQGLAVTRGYDKEKVVGPDAAIPQFAQQLSILKAVKGLLKNKMDTMLKAARAYSSTRDGCCDAADGRRALCRLQQ